MISRKLERYNGFIIQHIDNKTKFKEKILSTSFLFLHSLVKMLKFTSIVGYTSCGPTYIESFLTIFGQSINVLNYKPRYTGICRGLANSCCNQMQPGNCMRFQSPS